MSNRTFKESLGDWQVLYDNLAPQLTDMPLLSPDHTALGALLGQARDLENRQEAARAQLRDVNQQRRQMLKQGGDTSGRLALGLKSILGAQNEKLIEFGVKPRPRKLRRKKAAAPPPVEAGAGNVTAGARAPQPQTAPPVSPAKAPAT
jgi:hypothetical protein